MRKATASYAQARELDAKNSIAGFMTGGYSLLESSELDAKNSIAGFMG